MDSKTCIICAGYSDSEVERRKAILELEEVNNDAEISYSVAKPKYLSLLATNPCPIHC
jgi:hypothetical protein